MAEKQLPTSYYFTIVVYPDEMPKGTINKLYELGSIFISPIHSGKKTADTFIGEFAPSEYKPPKKHQHLLVKHSNKTTANIFIQKLCMVLNNDFTGVSLHKEDCLVKSPEMMIRYFYHLDNPTKEHFNIELAFEDVPLNFTEEVIKAFNTEITLLVTGAIQKGEIENIQQIVYYYHNSAVLTKWLYTGRNMYVVNSQFNEIRRNGKVAK